MSGAIYFLGFVICQRLGELILARHNTSKLLKRGARAEGDGHYRVMVALHASWVLAIVYFGYDQPVQVGWLALYAVLQVFRVWILWSLGSRWTTRIIVLDEPLVVQGPYRFMRHPNYALVVAEIFVTPMVFGLTWVAVVFTILNALMLWVRISEEERAVSPLRGMNQS